MVDLRKPLRKICKKLLGTKPVAKDKRCFPEINAHEQALVDRFRADTMTGDKRQFVLLKALEYVDRRNIAGAIVECGVWRGGNMLMAKAARAGQTIRRDYYLYDTFTGMTEPDAVDIVTSSGLAVHPIYLEQQRDGYNEWCYSSLEDVKQRFLDHGLLDDSVHFIKGPVEETLPAQAPDGPIAVLRLDTDWYASTQAELSGLFPLLQIGGVLIIDDYGTYEGARRATDEFLADYPLLLIPIDADCRVAIKV